MKDIVNLLDKYEIYTLIDMHQDLFSEKFCGEGVPAWAAIPSWWAEGYLEFPEPVDSPYPINNITGFPNWYDCAKHPWSDYYFTIAQATAVQNLYDNYDGLLDSWGDYWNKLATIWKDDGYVMGYELINEPWAGDIFTDPSLLVPGVADYVNLQPTYQYLSKYIRAVDDKHCIFFESITWDDVVLGFTEILGGEDYANRSVLSYHVYIPPNISPQQALDAHYREIQDLGCGWFCTETWELGIFDVADQYFQSWLFWHYKSFAPPGPDYFGAYYANGTMNLEYVSIISRTYATAIAGHSQLMSFNTTTKEFILEYRVNTVCTLPTEIYLNEKMHYPNGYIVTLNPPNMATWNSPSTNNVYIIHSPQANNTTLLTVNIIPK
eukprot:TRINITY_DN1041_c0_g1_i6.p1 TRINITY_DN1041_c0_g1~~TRINITY_DN1041_c0_g1_i6.p1  ORF type:complete len:379 (+),score=54.65 TRINITY_DN1041_c0_g1_i6:304-1440(+)